MARPIKKFRSGQLEVAIWLNERQIKDDTIVGFKTVSLRKSWKDEKNVWRDSTIQLRKHDIPRILVLMNKTMEELLLTQEEKAHEDKEEEDEENE
ncbi:MAG TPA: hypothetical protein VJI68_00145 [Candidatus Nanoarchaeia archaeon]|nr:hypothetical protein [Candidatus Nanoarchaeia archaeon]